MVEKVVLRQDLDLFETPTKRRQGTPIQFESSNLRCKLLCLFEVAQRCRGHLGQDAKEALSGAAGACHVAGGGGPCVAPPGGRAEMFNGTRPAIHLIGRHDGSRQTNIGRTLPCEEPEEVRDRPRIEWNQVFDFELSECEPEVLRLPTVVPAGIERPRHTWEDLCQVYRRPGIERGIRGAVPVRD